MSNKSNQREFYTKGDQFKNGIKVLAVVGLSAGYYGFKIGRSSGYDKGLKEGYAKASTEFVKVMKELTEELRGTARGE